MIPSPTKMAKTFTNMHNACNIFRRISRAGLYTAVGTNTCASKRFAKDEIGLGCDYAAIPKCEQAKIDLEDYVSWGIDHLKVDGCAGWLALVYKYGNGIFVANAKSFVFMLPTLRAKTIDVNIAIYHIRRVYPFISTCIKFT